MSDKMKTVCFTGHRPSVLKRTPHDILIIWRRLYVTIEKLIVKKGTECFISGGALGVDQMAFMCVHWLKKKYPHIKNIMAIPFSEQPIRWEKDEIEKYEEMKRLSDQCVYVDELPLYRMKNNFPTEKYHASKMYLRNMYMVNHSDLVIAVYKESEGGGTYNCIQYAKKIQKSILYIDLSDGLSYRMEKGS